MGSFAALPCLMRHFVLQNLVRIQNHHHQCFRHHVAGFVNSLCECQLSRLRNVRNIYRKVFFPKCELAGILSLPHQCGFLQYDVYLVLDPIYFQAGHRGRQFPLGYLVYFIDYLASIAFVGEMIPQKKRKLALYPIIIFYLFLSWFVLIV